MKQELMTKIDEVNSSLSGKIVSLDKKIDIVDKKLTSRLYKLGKQLAYLEDDTPTREEFDGLDTRIKRVEPIVASA